VSEATEIDTLNVNLPHAIKNKLMEKIQANYLKVENLLKSKIKAELKLKHVKEKQPFHYAVFSRLSIDEKVKIRALLNDLIACDIIRPSSSEYASRTIRKRDRSIRMCVDYRILNKVTTRNNYPLIEYQ